MYLASLSSRCKHSFLKSAWNKIYKKIYFTYFGRWGWSFCVSLILFLLINALLPKTFYTNDDENILYTLAGYYTAGVPADHSFINVILAKIIGFLYTVIPSFPWYGLFHLFVLGGSTIVLYKTLLEYGSCHEFSFLLSNSLAALGFAGIIMYPTILLQFTTTSACAGGAALLLILSIDFEKDCRKKVYFEEMLSLFFVLICFMHRKNSGMILFCFYFSTLLYKALIHYIHSRHKKTKLFCLRTIAVFGAITVLSAVFVNQVSINMRSSEEWDFFYEFENSRYKMTDYSHDSYDENPALYEELQWSRELYVLGAEYWWFFMDERINSESFEAIANTGYYENTINIEDIGNNFISLFNSNPITSFYLFLCILFLLSYIAIFVKKNKNVYSVLELLFLLCMSSGAVLLCLYLCFKGRFIQRAFHAIIIPYLCISYYLLIKNIILIKHIYQTRKNIRQFIYIWVIFMCIGICQLLFTAKQETDYRVAQSTCTLFLENYAMEHKENIYIYDVSLTFRYMPFVCYENQYPVNLFFWGGMGWNSPAFMEQLELNNLNNLYSEQFFSDNVYYVTREDYLPGGISIKERLCNYMAVEFPGFTLQTIDHLPYNITVYKFS